jgi:hypothetical protein
MMGGPNLSSAAALVCWPSPPSCLFLTGVVPATLCSRPCCCSLPAPCHIISAMRRARSVLPARVCVPASGQCRRARQGRSTAGADGAGHSLHPVLVPHLHLVWGITWGSSKSRDRLRKNRAQRYHFDVENLFFSFCPLTEEEQQVPWNICGAAAMVLPTCPPPLPRPQYTTTRLKSMSIKAYNLDLGVLGVIRERVSYGVEKATTKGRAVSMRSSVRCTWAAWCGKGVGGGEVQHNKSGGGGARLSRCWRNEAHTWVAAGGTLSISEGPANAGLLTNIESPMKLGSFQGLGWRQEFRLTP